MASIEVETITDVAGLMSLESDWEELSRSRGGLPLPLTHKWFTAWWGSFGGDATLSVFRITDAGRVLAIAPFMTTRQPYRGVTVSKQKLMANGHSPFCGIIFHGESTDTQLRSVLKIIIDEARSTDVLQLCGLIGDETLLDSAVNVARSARRRYGTQRWLRTPIISVDGTFSDFFGQRSKKFRKSMRGKVNKFRRRELRVEDEFVTSRRSRAIKDMVRVSGNSWKRNVGTDLHTNKSSRRFIELLVEQFGGDGDARVWIARDQDVPIAFEIHIRSGGVTYPVRADFDENYRNYSPGSVVEFIALKDIFDGGEIHKYNSCADDYRYLGHWTSTIREVRSVEIFGSGIKPAFLHALEYRMLPAVRRLLSKGESNAE